jgi:hypothetical protein
MNLIPVDVEKTKTCRRPGAATSKGMPSGAGTPADHQYRTPTVALGGVPGVIYRLRPSWRSRKFQDR